MAGFGKNLGVIFCLLSISLFGCTNANYGLSELDNYIDDVDNELHRALHPNEARGLMQWGIGVFVAIVIGIVVAFILLCVCCGCMCYHCCCKTSPPPYTTLVVANSQPQPMAQPAYTVQQTGVGSPMAMQPAPYGQQPPYIVKT